MKTRIFGLYEWHTEKDFLNTNKHGFSFEAATIIFDDVVLRIPATKDGEDRFLAIGIANGIFLTVIYTLRGERKRIISARKARKDEKEKYEKHLRSSHEH